ncbi:MAG TPA: hypothetical protein PKZ16_00010 [bacterium]|nr:hypothetical protein [bacterium]HPL95588.1 hypothetical protein [bacterium]
MELNTDNLNEQNNKTVPLRGISPTAENWAVETGGEKNKKRIFWWLGLLVAVVIILTVVVLVVEKENKKRVANDNLPAVNNELEKSDTEEKQTEPLVRYGKMILDGTQHEVRIGEKMVISILIDTKTLKHPEVANIVLAAARLIYPADKLTLEKIDSKNSVLPMSIVQNKSAGRVEIVRGVAGNANPEDTDNGYTGIGGLMVSLEFMAKEAGSAVIEFLPDESSVLLDDGLGTKMNLEYENWSLNINKK